MKKKKMKIKSSAFKINNFYIRYNYNRNERTTRPKELDKFSLQNY